MDGLVGIVKQLESKHANLQFKVRTILADPMATRPDENYIMEVEKYSPGNCACCQRKKGWDEWPKKLKNHVLSSRFRLSR